jgi:hypothetical protein
MLALASHRTLRKVDYGLMLTLVMFLHVLGKPGQGARAARDADAVAQRACTWVERTVQPGHLQRADGHPVLLAHGNASQLLVGVNIGGVGTAVGSLASLISLAEFQRDQRDRTRAYMQQFTVINVGLLVLLLVVVLVAFSSCWIESGSVTAEPKPEGVHTDAGS